MQAFEGKVAVVTGAASGMGKAFSERFAQEGMKVVLADVEQTALDAVVTEFRQKEYDVTGVVADVSARESVEALAQKALDTYGKIHVLCNNAGVIADAELGGSFGGQPARMWEASLTDWEWTMNVNFWGVVHGIRTFVPLMLEHGEEGHIVNTASLAGLLGGSGIPIYGASKHAVVRLSEALYLQLRAEDAKISASVLCPGVIRTNIGAASRNRPEDLWDEKSRAAAEAAEKRREALQAAMEGTAPTTSGVMQPETVAEMVFEAVRDDKFYIITHDEYDPMLRQRFDEVMTRQNPGRSAPVVQRPREN